MVAAKKEIPKTIDWQARLEEEAKIAMAQVRGTSPKLEFSEKRFGHRSEGEPGWLGDPSLKPKAQSQIKSPADGEPRKKPKPWRSLQRAIPRKKL
jgi:hypothetical protein